jgi:hypothetical protein
MQVAGSSLSHMRGISVFKQILKTDGIPGIYRGFGTSAIGSLPGRVLALTSLEVSKDMMLKYTEGRDIPEATRVGIANGVAGMFSNLVCCVYYVPFVLVGKIILSKFQFFSFFLFFFFFFFFFKKCGKIFERKEKKDEGEKAWHTRNQ